MESGQLELSHKRLWYQRNQIMESLNSLGMPAVVDGSHALIRGVDNQAKWIVAANPAFRRLIGVGEKFDKAAAAFSAASGVTSVRHISPPGFSTRMDGTTRLDGCAMVVTMQSGKDAYVLPVSNERTYTGETYIEMVCLVPADGLDEWLGVGNAAMLSDRMLDAGRRVLRVYNGNDIPIAPMGEDDLIVEDSVRDAFVKDITGFLSSKDWYQARCISWKRSYLLEGPPGTGKTSLARWAASSLDMPCIGFDFTDRYADGGTFMNCMASARRQAPAMLVLDDLDRVISGENRTGVTLHTLQTALSGMGDTDGLIIIATVNRTGDIIGRTATGQENPLGRRFDVMVKVDLPNEQLRARYLKKTIRLDPISDATIGHVARMTEGWSFDDLRAVVSTAANAARSRRSEHILDPDVVTAVEQVRRRKADPIASSGRV